MTYSWSGPDSFTSTEQNPTISGATTAMAGDYYLTVINGACTSTAVATSVAVNICEQPPNQPPNISPPDGAHCVAIPATLQSSPFSDPDLGDTHAASQWQVRTNPGIYESPYIVFDSGRDTGNLTSIILDKPTLDYETIYYWRVRHQDNTGKWSSYSVETSFRTCDTRPGANVEVIRDDVPINFDQVNVAGCTFIFRTYVNPEGPIPGGISVIGPFVDITTTAILTPYITVGLPYDESYVRNEDDLSIFHWDGSRWEDITIGVDTDNNFVYGKVSSLSWFFIGGEWVWIDDATGVPVFPNLYVGVAAALMAGILAYFLRRRLMRQE